MHRLNLDLESLSLLTSNALVIHTDFKIQYLNDKSMEILGTDNYEQLANLNIFDFIHPDSKELVTNRLKEISNGGTSLPTLVKLVSLFGDTFYVEAISSIIEYNNRKSFIHILKYLPDTISEDFSQTNQNKESGIKLHSVNDLVIMFNNKNDIDEIVNEGEGNLKVFSQMLKNHQMLDDLNSNAIRLTFDYIKEVFESRKKIAFTLPLTFSNEMIILELALLYTSDNMVMLIAYDKTREEKSKKDLLYLNEFQKMLFDLSLNFLNADNSDYNRKIEDSFSQIGQFLNVDKIQFFRYDLTKHEIKEENKWENDNSRSISGSNNISLQELFPSLITHHFRGVPFEFVMDQNVNLNPYKKYFEDSNIKSHISLPIFKELECIGFLSFNNYISGRKFKEFELKLLEIFSKLFGNLQGNVGYMNILANKNKELEIIRLKNIRLIKEMQEEIEIRQKIEEDLKISSSQIQAAINNTPYVSIKWFDLNGTIILWNKASELLFGYTKEEVIGKSFFDTVFGPEHKAFFEQFINQLNNSTAEIEPFEMNFNRKDGTLAWLLTTLFMIKNFENEKIIVCMNIDITEQKNLEFKLQETIKEKDKFFSIIAHDLKTPFTGFLGMTKILSEEIDTLTLNDLKELSESLRESSINIYNLLDNLLEWARLQRGKRTLHKEWINLQTLIESNISILKPKILNKKINIKYKLDNDLTFIADTNMIDAILRNLITNALKFSNHNDTITIGAEKLEDYIKICIEDTGIGIPEDLKANLFNSTEKTSRLGTDGEPSTGLGLILCKEYIESHNGHIWVESEVSKGSKFCFTIPY